jgi:hypothetical protein
MPNSPNEFVSLFRVFVFLRRKVKVHLLEEVFLLDDYRTIRRYLLAVVEKQTIVKYQEYLMDLITCLMWRITGQREKS